MAKMRFKHKTSDVLKANFVRKKTFKIVLIALCCVSLLLVGATYRLYVLGDLNGIITALTTNYNNVMTVIKGLF